MSVREATGFSRSIVQGAHSLVTYRIPKRPRQPDATTAAPTKSKGYRRPREPQRRRLESAPPEAPKKRSSYVPVGVRKMAIRKAQLERAAAWKAAQRAIKRAADGAWERAQRLEALSLSGEKHPPIERAKCRRVVLDSEDEAEDDDDKDEEIVIPGRRRCAEQNGALTTARHGCSMVARENRKADGVERKAMNVVSVGVEQQRKGCVSSRSSEDKQQPTERVKCRRMVLDSEHGKKEDNDVDIKLDPNCQHMEREEAVGAGNSRRAAIDGDDEGKRRKKAGTRRRDDSMEVTLELLDLFD